MDIPQSFRKISEGKTEQLLESPKIIEDREDCIEHLERIYPRNLDDLFYSWMKIPVDGEDFDSLSKIIEHKSTFMVRVNELRGPWFTRLTYYIEGGEVWVQLPWNRSYRIPIKVYVYGRPHINNVKKTVKELSKGAEGIIEKINQQFLTYLKKE